MGGFDEPAWVDGYFNSSLWVVGFSYCHYAYTFITRLACTCDAGLGWGFLEQSLSRVLEMLMPQIVVCVQCVLALVA